MSARGNWGRVARGPAGCSVARNASALVALALRWHRDIDAWREEQRTNRHGLADIAPRVLSALDGHSSRHSSRDHCNDHATH
jgi:hypothetical protein